MRDDELIDRDAPPALVLCGERPSDLLRALDRGSQAESAAGPCRLVLFEPTPSRRQKARSIIERERRWVGRQDIFFTPRGLADDGGKVAFLFPGIEATFSPQVDDVVAFFDAAALPPVDPGDIQSRGLGVVALGRLLHHVLGQIGVTPDMIAGHSTGEWVGMIAAAMIPPDKADEFVASAVSEQLEVPDLVFAALGCGIDDAARAIAGLNDIAISHDNCPRQSIICGVEKSVDTALARLGEKHVLCQKLPFRSGFHSPMFAEYLAEPERHFARMPLATATVPMWSATTCAPYPEDPEAIRALSLTHLTEPVRFRPLLRELYSAGARIFVQIGLGSLVGFCDDTLQGQPHLAIAAGTARRSGLEQLRRVSAALFVEGVKTDLDALPGRVLWPETIRASKRAMPVSRPATAAPVICADPASDPILAEFNARVNAIADASERSQPPQGRSARPPGKRHSTWGLTLSIEAFPDLADHAFYRQPAEWPHIVDRYPVVPMTMYVDLMLDAASDLVPERVVVGIQHVHAYRWLCVAPATTVTITARCDGENRVAVEIGNYAQGVVLLAREYAEPPAPARVKYDNQTITDMTAERVYDERWLFHGPAYRGIAGFDIHGNNGIRGWLLSLPARGALLDSMGQLFAYWFMNHVESDRLVFPIRIDRIDFFAPRPAGGERVQCTVQTTRLTATEVQANIELCARGQVWARVHGWVYRRFDTDGVLWPVLLFPERNALGEFATDGTYRVDEHWRTVAARDHVARRYLDQRELAVFDSVDPRDKRSWLLTRIAVKDAARAWLWKHGHGPLFPIEMTVHDDSAGRTIVSSGHGVDLHVAVSHADNTAICHVAPAKPNAKPLSGTITAENLYDTRLS